MSKAVNQISAEVVGQDEIFLPYAPKNGNLDELLKGIKDKKIETFA